MARFVNLVLIAIFILHVLGCAVHNDKIMSKKELQASSQTDDTESEIDGKIVMVVFTSGETVEFDDNGGVYFRNSGTINGRTKEGDSVEIAVDDISYVRVETLSTGQTILATVGVTTVALVGLAVLSIPFSCPYVYSFDGERYVFDAEPLGGSVCRGMERTDHSRLEHIRHIEGEYRLLVSNETDETQYIDQIKLVVADHPRGSRVVPGFDGSLHVVQNPSVPKRAVDENGNDLGKFLANQDGIAWQSDFPGDGSYREGPIRHELEFEFSIPEGTTEGKLVVNAGTALWGSNMIKEMLQLRGEKVDEWYDSINSGGPAVQELINFNVREELYFLRFYLEEGGEWAFRGWIPAGGPLVTEDRVIPVDLSGVEGEKVVMQIRPPKGFWTIDYIALEIDDHPAPRVYELGAIKATDQDGISVADLLSDKDGRRQIMPRVGDRIVLEFGVPPQDDGTERTVFLKSTGYYEIHTDKTQPEQADLIAEILENEGMIVGYSMEKYLELFTQSLSRK